MIQIRNGMVFLILPVQKKTPANQYSSNLIFEMMQKFFNFSLRKKYVKFKRFEFPKGHRINDIIILSNAHFKWNRCENALWCFNFYSLKHFEEFSLKIRTIQCHQWMNYELVGIIKSQFNWITKLYNFCAIDTEE